MSLWVQLWVVNIVIILLVVAGAKASNRSKVSLSKFAAVISWLLWLGGYVLFAQFPPFKAGFIEFLLPGVVWIVLFFVLLVFGVAMAVSGPKQYKTSDKSPDAR